MRSHAVLAAVASLVLLVCCAGEDYTAEPGTETGPCFANGTCNAGLSCASDRCVRIAGGDGGQGETGTPASDGGGGGGDGGCAAPSMPAAIRCGGNGSIECAGGDSCCIDEGVCRSGSSSCNGSAIRCVSSANCDAGDHCCAAASFGSAVDACPARIVGVEATACRSECAGSEIELCFAGAGCEGSTTTCASATLVLGPAAASFELASGVCR